MFDILRQNIILYYADYLALRNENRQVTDNCKYYCVYDTPINLAYLVDSMPFFDEEDKYYKQSKEELSVIENKAGYEAIQNFVNNICNVKVMGCIDGQLMMKQIHQFSNGVERKRAFKDYDNWLSCQHYTHLQLNDAGDLVRHECTRYVAQQEYGTRYDPQVEYINSYRNGRKVEKIVQTYKGIAKEDI